MSMRGVDAGGVSGDSRRVEPTGPQNGTAQAEACGSEPVVRWADER